MPALDSRRDAWRRLDLANRLDRLNDAIAPLPEKTIMFPV